MTDDAQHPQQHEFDPDWRSPPGDTILDLICERGISRFKLGRLLNISDDNVLNLLKGDFLIDNDMASRLSETLGSTVQFWENREKQYREAISSRSEQDTKILMPSSNELITMAEIEWHNREERHNRHPMLPWTSGWISGYLTGKGSLSAELKKERERVLKDIGGYLSSNSFFMHKGKQAMVGLVGLVEYLESLRGEP